MAWFLPVIVWYLFVSIIGYVSLPITRKLFSSVFKLDFGYAFSKIIGLIILSYSVFLMGTLHIVPFTRTTLFGIGFIFLLINIYIFKKDSKPKKDNVEVLTRYIILVFEEILFFGAFAFWAFIRSQEPSIQSLEKFMDFGFMNSILRSTHFPPLDMWYSADPTHPGGFPINYYYFGHLMGAVLIRFTGISPYIGYNLILATIFGLGVSQTFSFVANIATRHINTIVRLLDHAKAVIKIIFVGILGSFIVNLGGNLHTIYLFTKGYPNDNPIPFWKILSGYNPTSYWYPNATRFIPFTIHEFPSYSWVVADLHGHVFDIPIVLLTLALLFIFFTVGFELIHTSPQKKKHAHFSIIPTALLIGFMCAIQYMTNAFDGPIYILLTGIFAFVLFKFTKRFFVFIGFLIASFLIVSLPFSLSFKPFVSGIGVNCSPGFLVSLQKLGPFLFEKGNCQVSPPWMLFVLWGFFWINFALLLFVYRYTKSKANSLDVFMLILFGFGTFLIFIPEFFYIKDIYPAHFRANTMFKLGYQAFIMMGLASTYTFIRIKSMPKGYSLVLSAVFVFFLFFIVIYPVYSIPSYYGNLHNPPQLDGSLWLNNQYPEDKELITYLNTHIKGQPVILEAQGDSYTDYDRISAYTGLPTVAGWWVHEWLWRGSSDVVGLRIPDIGQIYETSDPTSALELLKKYHVSYIIVSRLERKKYPNLQEKKFQSIARLLFRSSNGFGALYKLK